MDSRILAIPTRRAISCPLGEGIATVIEQTYRQNVGQFIGDATRLQALRDDMVVAVNTQKSAGPTLRYFEVLRSLAPKFPDNINCALVWESSLGYGMAEVESNYLQFDRVNLVYNLGAMLSQSAERHATSSLPSAYRDLEQAVGFFELLLEEINIYPWTLPIGLDRPTIESLRFLLLAQAQECFWAKAAVGATSLNTVLAKLAQGAHSLYAQCLVTMEKSPAFKQEWVDHAICKRDHFAAIAAYRMSLDCLDKQKHGDEVAYLTLARRVLSQSLESERRVHNEILENMKGLLRKVTGDLQRAESDNNLIYLQQVPFALPAIPQKINAKAVLPQPSESVPQLFELLLPFSVQHIAKAFRDRLTEFVDTQIVGEIARLNEYVQLRLAEQNLPDAIDAVIHPFELPALLLERRASIIAAGGWPALQGQRKSLAEMRVAVKEHLAALKPQSLGTDSQKALEKLEDYYRAAANGDATIDERIANSQHLVQILIAGDDQILKFLPDVDRDRDLARLCVNLQGVVGNLHGNAVKLGEYGQRVLVRAAKMDVMTHITAYMKQNKVGIEQTNDLEPVYMQMVKEFDSAFIHLEKEKSEVERLLTLTTARNRALLAKQLAPDGQLRQRQQALEALDIAGRRYSELTTSIQEGLNFYSTLLGELTKLEQKLTGAQRTWQLGPQTQFAS